MGEGVVGQDQRLQVGESSQLRWQGIQLIVGKVQVEQVCGRHQQLGGDHLQLIVREVEHQQALALKQPLWHLCQQVV